MKNCNFILTKISLNNPIMISVIGILLCLACQTLKADHFGNFNEDSKVYSTLSSSAQIDEGSGIDGFLMDELEVAEGTVTSKVQENGLFGNSRSVPIPIEMEKMLYAGRHVYDKYSTPTQGNEPTQVNLSMYIEGLSSFRTQTMDFAVDVYFQQYWKDSRLSHNESKRILIRDKKILERMWYPDVYFANARIAFFQEVTQPNFLVWIERDGTILYDTRVSMSVMCQMDLTKWPLDSQLCNLRILSYAFNIEELDIKWILDSPITRNPAIAMSDMYIVSLQPGWCDGNYSTGIWSCVTADFFLKREIRHHIMQSYVPTALIVVISWFSFWLDVSSTPARVSLSITTLLTLSTQANASRVGLEAGLRAIDVWMGVCTLMVFATMVEFTTVIYVQRQESTSHLDEDDQMKKEEDSDPQSNTKYRSKEPSQKNGELSKCCKKIWKRTFGTIYNPFKSTANNREEGLYPTDTIAPNECCLLLKGTPSFFDQKNSTIEPLGSFNINNDSPSFIDEDVEEVISERSHKHSTALNNQPLKTLPLDASSFQESSYAKYGPFLASSVTSSNHDTAPHSVLIPSTYTNGVNTSTSFGFETNCHLSTISTNTRSLSPNTNDWRSKEAERLANWTKMDTIKKESKNGQLKMKATLSNTISQQVQAFGRKISRSPHPIDDKECDGSFTESSNKSRLIRCDKWSTAYRNVQNKKKIAARHEAKLIDQKSRWLFPTAFILFNMFYWTYYLYII